MPVQELVNFRQKYPQYSDISDVDLANKLASKYPAYADLPSKVASPDKSVGTRVANMIPADAAVRNAENDVQHPYRAAINKTTSEFMNSPVLKTLINPTKQLTGQSNEERMVAPDLKPIPPAQAGQLADANLAQVRKNLPFSIMQQTMDRTIGQGMDMAVSPLSHVGVPGVEEIAGGIGKIPVGATNVGRIAKMAPVGKNFKPAVEALKAMDAKLGNLGTSTTGKAINTSSRGILPSKDILGKQISTLFVRAVNPSVSKLKKPGALESYNRDTVAAVRGISDNADTGKIKLIDANGNPVSRPNSVETMYQGLQQSKKETYSLYDKMNEDATSKGAKIAVPEIADSVLKDIKTNENFTNLHPNVVNDFGKYAERLKAGGDLSASKTQDLLEELNKATKQFHDKKDYSQRDLYADFAGKLRQKLDSTIEEHLNKSGYQNVRNQYKAYKTVESDLLKKVAQKELGDDKELGGKLLNTFAGEEFARGILLANPASLKTAMVTKGFQAARQWWRSPDRMISEMFEKSKQYPKLSLVKDTTNYSNPALGQLRANAMSSNPRPIPTSKQILLPAPTLKNNPFEDLKLHETARTIRPIPTSEQLGMHNAAYSIQEPPIQVPEGGFKPPVPQPTAQEIKIVNSKPINAVQRKRRELILRKYGIVSTNPNNVPSSFQPIARNP